MIALRAPILCCKNAKTCGVAVQMIRVTEGTADKIAVVISDARDNARAKMTTD